MLESVLYGTFLVWSWCKGRYWGGFSINMFMQSLEKFLIRDYAILRQNRNSVSLHTT